MFWVHEKGTLKMGMTSFLTHYVYLNHYVDFKIFFFFPAASSFVDHYVDVLFALSKKYFDNLCQWLTALVNTDGFPSNNVTKEQKQHFASLILKERANKRKLQEIVREFSLACTGLGK